MFAIGIVIVSLAGVIGVAIGLPGCGVKSAPIPPEYARPNASWTCALKPTRLESS